MTRSLPADVYGRPQVYERERRTLFAREWLLVAHEAEIPSPGDARALLLAGWPVFVRRGRDGALRAFHNVCRHRAGPLLWDDEERCETIRCRYHGWVYDDAGRLVRAPHFGEPGPDGASDIALAPIRLETWHGLVFLNLDPDAPGLDRLLAPLEEPVAALDLASFRLHSRASHPIACDWKVYVENYLEGYHVPALHPKLRAEIDWRSYRVEVHGDDGLVTHHTDSAASVAATVYGGLWAWLAPNAALNVYQGGMSLERMLPTGPDAMRVEYSFLFREHTPELERAAALAMCARVTEEDRQVCEAVQRNLAGGVYQSGPLSPRHENGVAAFQRWWRKRVGQGATEGGGAGRAP
ncbi:MAG: aromatic ring-hydroxylating oxygenase subunit alpha [Myxococcota bacterium]